MLEKTLRNLEFKLECKIKVQDLVKFFSKKELVVDYVDVTDVTSLKGHKVKL
jgi:hypothetical protein